MGAEEILNVLRTLVAVQTDDAALGKVAKALLDTRGAALAPQALAPASAAPVVVQPEHSGHIIIPADKVFTCTACSQTSLRTIAPVYSSMKTSAFRGCFEPELTKTNGVWADPNGNAAVDCPSCGAQKTVWIMGKVGIPFSEVPDGDTGGFS